jgi:hypothetical protein
MRFLPPRPTSDPDFEDKNRDHRVATPIIAVRKDESEPGLACNLNSPRVIGASIASGILASIAERFSCD